MCRCSQPLYSQGIKLKKTILTLLTLIFFIGCNGNEPSPKNNNVKKVENEKPKIKKEQPKEEYEKTISYQDIIMKINDINTNKKTNKRVKKIVKEYQYNVSDDDSKNSARKKALNQVKILILEEIGVFVESYLELNTVIEDKQYQKYFKEEIKNLTAGIIKTKIIDEKFDGKTYYVKASVLVDPDSVSEGISEILKIKANKSEISKLQKLLQSKEQEIDMRSNETITLQKKITQKELINRAKEQELKEIQLKLQKAQRQLKKYKREEISLNTELGQVQAKVQKAMQRIKNQSKKACMIRQRMTKKEVKNTIGNPDASMVPNIGSCIPSWVGGIYNDSCRLWYYGTVKIYFTPSGLVSEVSGCR